jgi:hypothetical protein
MSDAEWMKLLEDKRQAIERLQALNAELAKWLQAAILSKILSDKPILGAAPWWLDWYAPALVVLAKVNQAQSCRISCREGDASREIPGNQAPTE